MYIVCYSPLEMCRIYNHESYKEIRSGKSREHLVTYVVFPEDYGRLFLYVGSVMAR
ncbi:hypothetical protein SAMN02927921_01355 [Sinomicrobium oceani]|uniref:Uncharacterized protein n=1 Tax=Sinomicrobium oceani TaxID=1150368 RepID=A0A1K1NNQ9_9FLAO|nr:hypothetical protein [Sinomicrobium oceani]SFW36899.1 hypothetical protein SAMN02927921_01355 [Sinomicrobium oceani]